MASTSRAIIDDFLAHKRIAFVGVSRNASDFSRQLWGELKRRGYDLIPVNPDAAEIDGVPCVPAVTAIEPAPDRIRRVWM
jgi:predicted CoA-binding protein